MDFVTAILSGFGLSAPAGLNAWLPLFVTGLAHRFNLFNLTLAKPFDLLGETWVLIALGILLFVEIFVDKIPAVDTINDIIYTFIRPVAGGILFAGQSGAIANIDPVFGFILGLISAGGVHALKATSRPFVTATTGGLGNSVVSMLEDFVALFATVLALVVPVLAAILMALILAVAVWVVFRLRGRRRRHRAARI